MGNSSSHKKNHRYPSNSPIHTTSTPQQRMNPSQNIQKVNTDQLAVITVIFNPIQFDRRYELYRRFEQHMIASNVNLITVECLFESTQQFNLPKQTFQITNSNNPNHIQIIAPSILWLKENLINIAVRQLPSFIEYVAWIDADIEFNTLDWPQLTIQELDRFPIVQMFELSFFLGPGGKSDILRRDYSFGYSIRHQKPIDPKRYNEWYPHPGYAWAMRRSAFEHLPGLLDFCIVGSGDLHFAYGLLGRIDETIPSSLHPDYKNLAKQFENKLVEISKYGQQVSYVPVNIWHFWHGSRDDRKYVDRWDILIRNRYSPLTDLRVSTTQKNIICFGDASTVFDQASIARLKSLENDIVNYFKLRNEDNPNEQREKLTKPKVNPKSQPSTKPGQRRPNVVSQKPIKSSSSNFHPTGIVWSSGFSALQDEGPYHDDCNTHHDHHHHHHHHHDCHDDNTNHHHGHHGHGSHHEHHHHHNNDSSWGTSHHSHHESSHGGHQWNDSSHHHGDGSIGGHHDHSNHGWSGGFY